MELLVQKIIRSDEFETLAEAVIGLTAGTPLVLHHAAGSLLAFAAARTFEVRPGHVLLIAADKDKAEKLRDDCALLLGEARVRFFGARPTHQSQTLDMSSTIAQIETLKALTGEERYLLIASPTSIVEKIPQPEEFRKTILEVVTGGDYPFKQLIGTLTDFGFQQKDFVESYGDIAVRGGILDVFPFLGEHPIRLEFWGDTVESIREFDVLTQRSIRALDRACIVPSFTSRQDDESGEVANPGLTASLFDYLGDDTLVILDDPASIEREVTELFEGGATDLLTYHEVLAKVKKHSLIISPILADGSLSAPGAVTIDLRAISQPSFNASIHRLVKKVVELHHDGFTVWLTADTGAEAERLREMIAEASTNPEEVRKGVTVPAREGLSEAGVGDEELLWRGSKADPPAHGSHAVPVPLEYLADAIHSGFIYPAAKIALFTEHEIFNRLKRRGLPRRKRFKGISQKEMQQLRRSDHVVHIDHGIGTFAGLTKISVGNVEQEVMKLLFLQNDTLYVNLGFMNRVQKYSSQEGHIPKLSKLGAPDWDRAKAKAKKRIKDIARDIIGLYARRKHEQGFAFSPDSHWQQELEASFMYEDTPDQVSAMVAVKQDMENAAPMDRLICGDVGFGKTEIAVRAAFKAVLNGKQVAVLVPTTILALQHNNTFRDRLSRYTTRVENLTRFKSPKEQKCIVEELRRGSIDIIIGTHRILSKDIGFKDLGLLIIDEEHRFGVSAKEKLRQLKATVDTLTLTATPIPRTLHFSLIGARDLSLINTPPRNRLTITTELIPASDGRETHWRVVREAIIRELHRGGQIYFVHDRVQNIEAIANEVKKHVPEARVHVAHGQMPGHELEKTMLDFLEKKYDVLLATKIIESGLDIPNVNTIIINRADRFGLAELYQLRGRVGRSNVQAYAYLLVPPLSILPKHTLRRLQAIEEFTELGSGFNLAMRDLEIRGAGNIFGAEQTGYIIDMGFEMYERIVREAVDELKEEEFKEVFAGKEGTTAGGRDKATETVVDADIEALIPDIYVASDTERLDIYRRLYRAATIEELEGMRAELRDRFGEYPEEVEHLFTLVELRHIVSRASFSKVSLRGEVLILTLPPETNTAFYGTEGNTTSPFQRIVDKIATGRHRDVHLKQAGKDLTLQFSKIIADTPVKRIEEAMRRVEEIIFTHELSPSLPPEQK